MMNKRLFIIVIILMGISLAGIILLQLFWIRNAISIREDHFNKTVNIALRETADKLESHENILLLSDKINSFGKPGTINILTDSNDNRYYYNIDSSLTSSYSYNLTYDADADLAISVWNEDDDEVEVIEYKHEVRIDSLKRTVSRVKSEVDLDSISKFITHEIVFADEDGNTVIEGAEDNYIIVKRAHDLNEAFIKMAYEIETRPQPIQERIDSSLLSEILSASLFNKGIETEFEFGVLHIDSTKTIPLSSSGFDRDNISKDYLVCIFPNELQNESNYLLLQFPGRGLHLLKSMVWTLSGSLLLTLIILITFAITIFMILRQKKLSDIKSDFINNMTHEFKSKGTAFSDFAMNFYLALKCIYDSTYIAEP